MKTIIITGASSGIGKGIAKLFIDQKWNVVLNSLSEDKLNKTFEEFGSPENAILVAGDIGDKGTGQKLVDTALERFGAVDVLVNNAGVFEPKPFLDVEESDLDKFFKTNLKGTYFTTQASIKAMLLKNDGLVINIGTVLVDHAIAGFPATAPLTSKGGIHALTKQLAAEFGKSNIRVNTIAPGIIRSPLQSKIGVEDADSLAGLHLVDRIGEVEDIAKACFYLANSNFITGVTLNVDGGHVAGH
ncbi:SDR family NAD(P)-dependent oxidoreductase [Pedobacter immunditicola]|uniref:SDR family NAD(P)-dependent oxidoreductase n=1 Tax=Pedobacter immunditicola TaxID=3133440 RepID=UPI0030968EFB